MEVSGIVFRPITGYSGGAVIDASHSCSMMMPSSLSGASVKLKPIRKLNAHVMASFCDSGHLEYYNYTSTRCGGAGKKEKEKEKKMMKKRFKVLKGLSEIDFGLDHGLADQVKGQMISEAAEILLGRLQQLRAEEIELKRKRKEDKAKMKAARMMMMEASSSSESSSSDSECDEVVDMRSRLKSQTLAKPNSNAAAADHQETTESLQGNIDTIGIGEVQSPVPIAITDCCSSSSTSGSIFSSKKIEVCMGGKCKKSGAATLIEEFEKVVGGEGRVVGCKCMGKCRDGPNVRVLQTSAETTPTSSNPLCVGVGLEDVGLIVSNFFGGNNQELAPPAPAAAAS